MISYLIPLPCEYKYILGIVTKAMKKKVQVNILRVSKYAPIPKPIDETDLATETQKGVLIEFNF